MTILNADSLNFARRHFERFDDSDFFPPQEEFGDLLANWDYFVGRLTSVNANKLPLTAAVTMPVAKGRASYRVVHQLEPLTAIVYTALVHSVAPAIEAARSNNFTACSYRYTPDDGAFFGGGQGYENYRSQSEVLVQSNEYGAIIDIADFYNQIYSHRVRGAIEASSNNLGQIAHDIERTIHAINTGASKGIPVGCDASAMLAEGILVDVDQLIARCGVSHTRYVDDIRMFSNDPQKLQSAIETISEYLYEHHRLHLNSSKTRLLASEDFLSEVIQDHSDTETEAAMDLLGQFDPYGEDDIDEADLPGEAILSQIGMTIRSHFLSNGHVDLNLVKAYIRRAKIAVSADFVNVAIVATDVFIPAIHELVRAMQAVIAAGGVDDVRPLVDHLRSTSHYRRKAVKYWVDWLCAGSPQLLTDADTRDSVFASSLRIQARAAITTHDLAWVRAQRATFIHLPPMQRSAVIRSMSLIGYDERKHLLSQIDDTHASPVDVAVKRSVLM